MGDHATCRSCGAEIEWIHTVDDRGVRNGRIPLDVHESILGPGRFTISDTGEAIPVAAGKQALARRDHRSTCGQAPGGSR